MHLDDDIAHRQEAERPSVVRLLKRRKHLIQQLFCRRFSVRFGVDRVDIGRCQSGVPGIHLYRVERFKRIARFGFRHNHGPAAALPERRIPGRCVLRPTNGGVKTFKPERRLDVDEPCVRSDQRIVRFNAPVVEIRLRVRESPDVFGRVHLDDDIAHRQKAERPSVVRLLKRHKHLIQQLFCRRFSVRFGVNLVDIGRGQGGVPGMPYQCRVRNIGRWRGSGRRCRVERSERIARFSFRHNHGPAAALPERRIPGRCVLRPTNGGVKTFKPERRLDVDEPCVRSDQRIVRFNAPVVEIRLRVRESPDVFGRVHLDDDIAHRQEAERPSVVRLLKRRKHLIQQLFCRRFSVRFGVDRVDIGRCQGGVPGMPYQCRVRNIGRWRGSGRRCC